MNKKKVKITPAVIKTLLFSVVIILGILAVFSVKSNSSKKSLYNVVAQSPIDKDRYYINEPIHMGKGSIIVSNVEEFGPSNTNVAAIIHYYNTTEKTQVFRIRDLGLFTDGFFNYTMVTNDDREHMFAPGDSGIFKVEMEREEGVDGLWFYTSENLLGENHDRYQAIVLLDTQRDEETILAEKLALGIDPNSEFLDLSLPENQHMIQRSSVQVNDEGEIIGTTDTDNEDSESTDGSEIGISRNLTTREREALATRMTDDEVQEALSKVALPGLDEWGPQTQGDRSGKVLRDVEGLPILTQQEYFIANTQDGQEIDSEALKELQDSLVEDIVDEE